MKVSDNMKYSEERSFWINALFFILSIAGLFVGPLIFALMLRNFIKNLDILELVCNILFILVLYLMYFKDLNREAKTYSKNFKDSFFKGLKYYFLGLMAMIFFNLILSFIMKGVSANEDTVRNMLFSNPIYTMLSIVIIAPLSEELIFRKSLAPIIKNKWIYATICGLLFGGAHLLAGEFNWLNLLYIFPYGSLGFAFAIMDYETKSTFTSIVMHAIHNGITGIMLLIVYYMGAL